MAKVGFVLLCAVLIHTGYALQCYNCVSSPGNKNCDDLAEKDKVAIATCGKTAGPGYNAACIKKVIEDKSTKVQNTTRACILTKTEGNTRECDAASDRVNVLACEICSDDLCNSADHMQMSVMPIVASICAYLLIKFLQ